eukprot:CAMPEP_0194305370 /NCGR_PEP_ID=MMETSP0171-20130528/2821_1 /TAXON_ID=218684 /ORGANISM="Corethron pennatum, Strain L29A3" /LENGTH=228 /DNA_ID=CAMNT_0039056881 /DNA_START=241 /DNA_END=927 /DNA_ORIENTATION=-
MGTASQRTLRVITAAAAALLLSAPLPFVRGFLASPVLPRGPARIAFRTRPVAAAAGRNGYADWYGREGALDGAFSVDVFIAASDPEATDDWAEGVHTLAYAADSGVKNILLAFESRAECTSFCAALAASRSDGAHRPPTARYAPLEEVESFCAEHDDALEMMVVPRGTRMAAGRGPEEVEAAAAVQEAAALRRDRETLERILAGAEGWRDGGIILDEYGARGGDFGFQ